MRNPTGDDAPDAVTRPSDSRSADGPRISVVVVSRNRRAELQQALERLQTLPEGPPVIVVDNGSDDGTVAAVGRDHPGVRLIPAGTNLGAYGRTIGALAAATPYVAFCDDDAAWAPGSLTRAVAALDDHPGVGAVAGTFLVGREATLDPTSALMARSPLPPRDGRGPGPGLVGLVATASAVRRDPFLHAGGFHRRFGVGGEEGLLALDLRADGWDVCFVPDVVVHHYPSGSSRDPVARGRRTLRNDLWTTWLRHPLGRIPGAVWRRSQGEQLRTLTGAWSDASRGLGWVLRERRCLPEEVVAELDAVARAERPGRERPGRAAPESPSVTSPAGGIVP